MSQYNVRDGRIWIQTKKFQPYQLLLPYGMTNISDPSGSLNAVREPDAGIRGTTKIVDILRTEPGLPTFTITTRLYKTLNWMLGLRNARVNFQVHLGACDRADNFRTSSMGLQWQRALRGDLGLNTISQLQGDDSPIEISVPWSAELGPMFIDFKTEFMARSTITADDNITASVAVLDGCDDSFEQFDIGDVAYLAEAPDAAALPQVWYTTDAWESSALVSSHPFVADATISDMVLLGIPNNHRLIASRGSTVVASPAQIAYADITTLGTVTWNTVSVGAVTGEFITSLYWGDFRHLFATTDLGNVYRSLDGGVTWELKHTATETYNDVSAVFDGMVWAVGDANQIALSMDRGDSWSALVGPSPAVDLTAVSISPDGTVFVGNADGELYGSYNHGRTWERLSLQGVTPTAVTKVVAHDDSNIWVLVATATGGRALRSVDGGASFMLWDLNMPANSGLSTMYLVDVNNAVVGGAVHTATAFVSKTNSKILG